MTGSDEGCVHAIWVTLTLWSLLDAGGSVLCADVKHRGGSHGVEVNVLFGRQGEPEREREKPSTLPLLLCPICHRRR